MTDLTPYVPVIIAIVTGVIAYYQKSQKDEAAAFMEPANIDVTKAPSFVPATAFVMSPETKAEIVAGRSLEETQKILAVIQQNEDARVKSYTIKTSDGEYGIEYGYIKTRPVVEEGNEPLPSGDFDPKIHTAEEAGIDKKGDWVRGLHMPESRLKNLVHNHTLEDQASLKEQVANAEAQGERNYIAKFSGGFYIIENGIVIGGSKG